MILRLGNKRFNKKPLSKYGYSVYLLSLLLMVTSCNNFLYRAVTDRCDFRYSYCMAEDMTFLPRSQVLSLEKCQRPVRTFVGLEVTKVRITGG